MDIVCRIESTIDLQNQQLNKMAQTIEKLEQNQQSFVKRTFLSQQQRTRFLAGMDTFIAAIVICLLQSFFQWLFNSRTNQ